MHTLDLSADQLHDDASETVVYARTGAGAPLVYLHGETFVEPVSPLHSQLAGHFDLIAPVHPGFRGEDVPRGLSGLEDVVLLYRRFFDQLELDQVHLVGYSLGAWIAASFAVFFPERCRSLVLIAPFGLRVPDHPISDFLGVSQEDRARMYFNRAVVDEPTYWPDAAAVDGFMKIYGEAAATARLMWNPRYDIRLDRRLRHVHVPTLVLQAGQDQLVPSAVSKRFSDIMPNARLQRVDDAPHAIVVEQPDDVTAAITSFVDGLS